MVVRVLIKFLPPRCHRNYGIENLGGAGREGAEEARVVQPHLSVKGLRRLSLLLFPSGGLLLFLLVSRLNFFSLLFSKFFDTSKESESEKANREKILPAGMFGRLAIKMMVRKKMYASLKKFFPLWAQVSMHRIMQLLVAKITHELRATAMLEHVLFSTWVQPLTVKFCPTHQTCFDPDGQR